MKKHKNFYIISFVLLLITILSILDVYKCPYKYFIGIPCITCGLTRAFTSIIKLDFKSAFHYHALWPVPLISYLIYTLKEYNLINLSKKTLKILSIIIVIIFFIYYIYRLLNNNAIVNINFKESLLYKIIKLIW